MTEDPNGPPGEQPWVQWLKSELPRLYREAVEARIRYEVHKGETDTAILDEMEHAFSHVVSLVEEEDVAYQGPHIESHMGRVMRETYEFIAEELYADLRARHNTFRVLPLPLTKRLWGKDRRELDTLFAKMVQLEDLVVDGRLGKGDHENWRQTRDKFRDATLLAKQLDRELLPYPIFSPRVLSLLAVLAAGIVLLGHFGYKLLESLFVQIILKKLGC